MRVFLLAVLLAASSCVFAFGPEGKRVDTPLVVSEFNSIASRYIERPTHVSVKKTGSDLTLWIEFDPYDSHSGTAGTLMLAKKYVDDYVAYIDKYQDWAEKATASGDAFQKDIGKASSQIGYKLKFSFYSGNAKKHYLVISPCLLLMCTDGVFFDADNAVELKKQLIKLRDGELTSEDVSQKYN